MGLRGFVIKRIIYSFLLVLFVLVLNFVIFQVMPGNPIELFAGAGKLKNEQQKNEVIASFGLDQPITVRFQKYVVNMLTGQFGISFISQNYIATEVVGRLSNTLLLMGTSEILAMVLGILLGVIAAKKRGGLFDNASVVMSLTTYSLPSFWMGMIFLLIFYKTLGWFPGAGAYPRDWVTTYAASGGFPPRLILGTLPGGMTLALPSLTEIAGRLWHLTLPTLTLTLFTYGGYLLLTRATMLEALTEDYIVTARAKGLSERTVLYKHALKNASLPLITSIALTFGFILSGAIITEQVFTYPGLGQWTWNAIQMRDYPALQAIFYITAISVIVANFIADILYGLVDPRIKYR
jgi:peptide/nickel transport system permease protein